MWNFQGIAFIWTEINREIFESALVHLKSKLNFKIKFSEIINKFHDKSFIFLKVCFVYSSWNVAKQIHVMSKYIYIQLK